MILDIKKVTDMQRSVAEGEPALNIKLEPLICF